MNAAVDAEHLRKEVWIAGGAGKLIPGHPVLHEGLLILWKIDIVSEPLRGLLHRPVVDLRLGPGLPQVANGYLLVLLVEQLLPPPVRLVLRVGFVMRFCVLVLIPVTRVAFMQTRLPSSSLVPTSQKY